MMLALRPDLCDQEALNTVVCPPNEEGMMDVRGVYRWQAFADYTPTGALLPELCPCLLWVSGCSACCSGGLAKRAANEATRHDCALETAFL